MRISRRWGGDVKSFIWEKIDSLKDGTTEPEKESSMNDILVRINSEIQSALDLVTHVEVKISKSLKYTICNRLYYHVDGC